jgi:hypothetical protein
MPVHSRELGTLLDAIAGAAPPILDRPHEPREGR